MKTETEIKAQNDTFDFIRALLKMFEKTLNIIVNSLEKGEHTIELNANVFKSHFTIMNELATDLGKTLAGNYDAPEWEEVLDCVTWKEASRVVEGQSYHRPGMPSIGMRTDDNNSYNDAEGACQVGGTLSDGKRNTAYPDPCVQGQCWNETMTYLFGLSESKDMMATGNDYLYGPASNIHRTTYGGRSAEYHSEDGFLAGKCLANVTKGLADGGIML